MRYSGMDMPTEEIVSAAEANRNFSRLLRGVREGRRYIVTAHGKAVAQLVPAGPEDEIDRRVREVAKEELLRRLERQPARDIGRWTRDELYER
jgi:prevent-host-death family protein